LVSSFTYIKVKPTGMPRVKDEDNIFFRHLHNHSITWSAGVDVYGFFAIISIIIYPSNLKIFPNF